MVLKQGQDAFEERYRLKTRGVYLNVISKHVSVSLDMPVEEILFKGLAFRNRHRQSVLRGKALAKEGGYHLNQAYFYIDKVNMYVNFAGVMRDIIFYETASGQKPIEKFFDQLSAKQAQKVVWVLKLVEELDRVPTQYFKKLVNTDELWEVRVRIGSNIFRLIGFFDGPNLVILAHAFQKKTQKTPKADIEIAEDRKNDYFRRKMK